MNHIPDTGKMVETPRTDAEVNGGNSMGVLMGNGLRDALIKSDFARQLERELARCNNLYRKLDVHSLNLSDLIRQLELELREVQSENIRLRAALELQEANKRIRLLIAERDSARQQADLRWKLREEFTALLGTDDVKEAVRGLQLMKAALECAVPSCDYLHHKKAHQHASGGKCIPEELVRMAKRISTTQTK